MSTKTKIAWTDHTFNIAWGCSRVDPGCANCYAATFAERIGLDLWGNKKARRTFGDKYWRQPEQWHQTSIQSYNGKGAAGVRGLRRPHLVFCSSMCDVFEDHPTIDAERQKLWPLIRRTPVMDWQILTKRADRIAANLPDDWSTTLTYRSVWLGVSVSEPKGLWRVDALRQVPAAVRFVSYEPALGDISQDIDLTGIHWVIFGGESGTGYRAPAGWLDWARAMRDRCRKEGVAFFFKQSPALRTEMGTTLDGETIREFPGS